MFVNPTNPKTYTTTNSEQNRTKLALVYLSIAPLIVSLQTNDLELFWIVIICLLEAILIWIVILWFRASAFELAFYDDKIIQSYKYKSRVYEFSYPDLLEVHYSESYKSSVPSSNTFVLEFHGRKLKLRTNLTERGENYILFIRFLKERNHHFETFIKPKGTKMHTRLRQEILGTKY